MIRFDGPGELGIIFWDKIIELTGLLNGEAWGRTSDRQLRIFKNDAGQHCGRCFRTSSFQRNRREKRRTGIPFRENERFPKLTLFAATDRALFWSRLSATPDWTL
jgi:hypothetical protein